MSNVNMDDATTLKVMLKNSSVGINEVAYYLEGLDFEERVAELFTLGRQGQRRLYERAQTAAPLSLNDFVPAGVDSLTPVHHSGKNTLPVLKPLKLFEKRFCRAADGSDRLFGYNENPPLLKRGLGLIGFFVAYATDEHASWEERGGVVIDYFQTPDGEVAQGWPKVIPNTHRLQTFVYNGTRDFMRRVADGVSIGAAYKGEKKLDHYFVLARQPVD